jgi:hypothetical protein
MEIGIPDDRQRLLTLQYDSGGLYETKTIGAMIYRITLTLVFSILAHFTLSYFERIFKAKMSF